MIRWSGSVLLVIDIEQPVDDEVIDERHMQFGFAFSQMTGKTCNNAGNICHADRSVKCFAQVMVEHFFCFSNFKKVHFKE